MFRGIQMINMDDKGRLTVPSGYRDQLMSQNGGKLIATIDTEVRCLLLYPLAIWEEIEQKVQALPSFNPSARRIQRLLLGYASELEMDSHSRILIPSLLRDHGGIKKQVVFIGQGKKFELWDSAHWDQSCRMWLEDKAINVGELPPEVLSLTL